MLAPQRLPLGIQDFQTIIEEGYLYVDKTEYLHQLMQLGKSFFISRPRRFGKSLTVSVLAALYSAQRELFSGLWIEDKWNWDKKHPILSLSFTGISIESLGLEVAITQELHTQAAQRGLSLSKVGIAPLFKELLEKVASQGKVVVLVDEYDAPIVQYLGRDTDLAIRNRDILREFYTVLKNEEARLELVFITGVSKFSKVGIFSGLNNLIDLSGMQQFASMFGYTQQELELRFSTHLELTNRQIQLGNSTLLDEIKRWYNGYRFHQNGTTVYNPVSLNMFLTIKEFNNFWFETGTPTFLINLLRERGLYNFNLEPKSQIEFESFELENIHPYSLLYQTGYLTIQSVDAYGLYHLDYPNYEVKHAMLAYLLEAFSGVSKGNGLALVVRLEQALIEHDVDKAMRLLQSVFKNIPYHLQDKYPERFYHAAIHLLFTYFGLRVNSEVCTSDGRTDCVVETEDRVYVLEFKLDKSPEAALEQIRKKQYYQAWWERGKPVVGVGVNFSSQSHNIEAWATELVG